MNHGDGVKTASNAAPWFGQSGAGGTQTTKSPINNNKLADVPGSRARSRGARHRSHYTR